MCFNGIGQLEFNLSLSFLNSVFLAVLIENISTVIHSGLRRKVKLQIK